MCKILHNAQNTQYLTFLLHASWLKKKINKINNTKAYFKSKHDYV